MQERGSEDVRGPLSRTRRLQLTLAAYVAVTEAALERGAWFSGEAIDRPEEKILRSWVRRLAACGSEGAIVACPRGHGRPLAITRCCSAAPCPRHQRRRSDEWVKRVEGIVGRLKRTRTHSWKLVTLNAQRGGPTLEDGRSAQPRTTRGEIVATQELRRDFVALARDRFGLTAAVGAVELGGSAKSENVHLHVLVYSAWIDREAVQRWLRARDCTIPGCEHPADDRCDGCRAAKHGCDHADGTRVRCNGSWVVDVRAIKARQSRKGGMKSAEAGLREALKYAAKPVTTPVHPGRGLTLEELLHVENVLRFYVALRGKHRVQSYGLARQAEDDEPDELADDGARGLCCERCGKGYVILAGWLWHRRDLRLQRVRARPG